MAILWHEMWHEVRVDKFLLRVCFVYVRLCVCFEQAQFGSIHKAMWLTA